MKPGILSRPLFSLVALALAGPEMLRRVLVVLGLSVLALGACTAPPPADTVGYADLEGQPEAVERAVSWLAARLELAPDEVRLLASERREWSDSCLGLGGPAESCLAMMTPGWRVEAEAGGRRYELRTDETGQAIRSPQLAPRPPGPPGG